MTRQDGRCESCARRPGEFLMDFRDHGPVFLVCGSCADEARDRGCLVFEIDGTAVEAAGWPYEVDGTTA